MAEMVGFQCILGLLFVTFSVVSAACPSGWLQHDSICYQFPNNGAMTYSACESYCTGIGGNTLCIEDSMQMTYALSHSFGQNLWVSLNDQMKEGRYEWGAGCDSTFIDWAPSEPTETNVENCGIMYSNAEGFNDVDCGNSVSNYCACQGNPAELNAYYPSDGTCPEGFDYSYGDKCYAMNVQLVSWPTCQATCAALHANMLCVNSQQENDYLYAHNGGLIHWLGYHDPQGDSTFQWNSTCASVFTNWALDEPDLTGSSACAGLWPSLNGWSDFACSDTHMCSCEWTSPVAITDPPQAVSPCGLGWDVFEGKCYYFSAPDADFLGCRTFCDTLNSTMPCVQNANQNSYLGTTKGAELYVGYSDIDTEGVFAWETGCNASFTNWSPDEPNDYGGNEDCATDHPTGRWNDVTCSDSFACVCEKGLAPPVPVPSACPNGWQEHDNTCYLFDIANTTWDSCQATCSDLQASMLYIGSLATDIYIHDAISDDTWLGYNDRVTEGVFVWEGNHAAGYFYWHRDQPENADGNEDCAFLDKTRGYSWTATACAVHHLCACQMPLSVPAAHPTVLETVLVSPTYRVDNGFAFAAIGADGRVHTWGESSKGSAVLPRLTAVKDVIPSRFAFAAVTGNGSIVAWGARTAVSGAPLSPVHRQLTLL